MWGRKQPKILIVEDDVNNHPLFQTAYEKEGFTVLLCLTAEGDFISEVADFAPDIIHMDLMIAKVGMETQRDGFEAIKLLQTDERTKDIPIAVVSSFTAESKVMTAKELGAIDYYNLQGYSVAQIAKHMREYIDASRRYRPSHPLFR